VSERQAVEVNFPRLRQELEWALEPLALELGRERALERVAIDAGCPVRRLRAILAGEGCTTERAGRLLDAIGYRDGPRRNPVGPGYMLPLVIRSRYVVDGRRRQPGERGRIKKVDWKGAKLTERQLRAVYRLHIEGGLSLREIARRGFEAWGCSTAKSASQMLSARLRSMGLEPRPQGEATAKANQERPGVVKPPELSKNEWRRQLRAERRRVDPEFRRGELERIAGLRERERAAA
jgi:hypothetical protein